MSINFEDDMGSEAAALIRQRFEVTAMDKKTALLEKVEAIHARQMSEIARAAGQALQMEVNEIGDRKEVGGVVYELDEKGWRRLPIGTPVA